MSFGFVGINAKLLKLNLIYIVDYFEKMVQIVWNHYFDGIFISEKAKWNQPKKIRGEYWRLVDFLWPIMVKRIEGRRTLLLVKKGLRRSSSCKMGKQGSCYESINLQWEKIPERMVNIAWVYATCHGNGNAQTSEAVCRSYCFACLFIS